MNKATGIVHDAAIIRAFLLFLLVGYHSFAPYSGAWDTLDGVAEVKFYWWIGKFFKAFLLESWVFVSGYTFGFKVKNNNKELELATLIPKKLKRLILPCIFFSFLYICLFQDVHQPVFKTLYDIINGVGHLWFLPMLFWCFVGVLIIEKSRIKPHFIILLLFICMLLANSRMPFQMGKAMYYMSFFYFGYLIQRDNFKVKYYLSKRNIYLWIALFILMFPIMTLAGEGIKEIEVENTLAQLVIVAIRRNSFHLIYSLPGLLMLFSICSYVGRGRDLPKLIIELGKMSMGIYILHQFILKNLYYNTTFPEAIGTYLLPWLGFAIAFLVSVIVTRIMKELPILRELI